jgi:hypothetical protein
LAEDVEAVNCDSEVVSFFDEVEGVAGVEGFGVESLGIE